MFRKVLELVRFGAAKWRGELMVGSCTLEAAVIRADGSREELGVVCRKKVTVAFVQYIAASLAGANAPASFHTFIYHELGTGNTAEANTQTALVTPISPRLTGDRATNNGATTGVYRTIATYNHSGAQISLTEHGVFNASNGGTLLDRSLFTAVVVNSGDQVQFTYSITFQAEA